MIEKEKGTEIFTKAPGFLYKMLPNDNYIIGI